MTEGGAGRGPRPHDHPPSLRCIPYTFVVITVCGIHSCAGFPSRGTCPPPPPARRCDQTRGGRRAAGGTSRRAAGPPPPVLQEGCVPRGAARWLHVAVPRGVRQPKTKRHAAPPCGVGDRPLRRRRVGMYPQRGPQCLSVVAWHGCLRGSVGAAGAVFAGTVRTNRRPLCLSCRCFQCVADPALNRRRHFDGMQTPARRRPRRCARPIRPPPRARG